MTVSLTEILVLVAGLGLGYWVVSRLIDIDSREKRTRENGAPEQPGSDADAAKRRDG